jgi:hypothetical protein
MHAQTEEDHRLVACLKYRINGSAEIGIIADAIISMFADMNTALVPIIGGNGVSALYRRSLLLCTAKHPALAQPYESLVVAIDLPHFRSVLVDQTPLDALGFAETLLHTTYELLATLIGPSLCARLLYAVWEQPLSAPPAQEKLP